MKFIHLANAALLSEKKDFGRFSVDRATEYRRDFEQVLKVCRDEKIDALFITGNLFCRVPETADLKSLDESFSALEETRVFILPGEKDAPESAEMIRSYAWKSRTTVFAGDCVDRVNVSKLNCEITGVGYLKDTWNRVKVSKLTRGRKAAMQILLLPFAGNGASDDLPENFEAAAFDYVGIGQYAYLEPDGKGRVYSPGLFEPLDFSEQLKHGYFIGELDAEQRGADRLRIRFVPGAKREYITLKVNVTEENGYFEVEEQLKQAIAGYGADSIYRVVLDGKASDSLWMLKNSLYELGNVVSIDGNLDHSGADAWYEESVTGEAIRRFMKMLPEGGDPALTGKAALIGKRAFFDTAENETAGSVAVKNAEV